MMFTVMLSRTFAFVIFHAFGCITEVTAQDTRHPGYDCQGKVGNGTVIHRVDFTNGNYFYCCYPVVCSGGDFDFCSKDLGRDQCSPCAGPKCNYKTISSQNVVKKDGEHCNEKCIYGTPIVGFDPPQQTSHRGKNVTLNPIVKSDNLVKHFYWMKDNNVIALRNITKNKYKIGTNQNLYSLIISDTRMSDEGIYSLVVIDSAGTYGNGSIEVNVISRPLITMATHGHADAGSTFVVLCRVDGNSLTTSMTFKHRNEQTQQLNVSLHDGGIKYTIRNISSKDVGYYSCIAENSQGKDERSMYLSVYSKPEIKFPDDNRTFTFDSGDNMSIPISVTYKPQLIELSCRHHGSTIPLPLKGIPLIDGIWMIFDVAITNIQPHDGGNFTCDATNRLGTTRSEIYISVKPKEETVKKDQQKTETDCTAAHLIILLISAIQFLCGVTVLSHVCRWRLVGVPKKNIFIVITWLTSAANCIVSSLDFKACDAVHLILMSFLFAILIIFDFVLFWVIRIKGNTRSKESGAEDNRTTTQSTTATTRQPPTTIPEPTITTTAQSTSATTPEPTTPTTTDHPTTTTSDRAREGSSRSVSFPSIPVESNGNHEGSPDHSHNDEAVSSDSICICKTLDFIMDEETNKEASSSSSDGAEEEPLLNHSQNDKPGNDLEEDITELTTFDTAGNHTKETSV